MAEEYNKEGLAFLIRSLDKEHELFRKSYVKLNKFWKMLMSRSAQQTPLSNIEALWMRFNELRLDCFYHLYCWEKKYYLVVDYYRHIDEYQHEKPSVPSNFEAYRHPLNKINLDCLKCLFEKLDTEQSSESYDLIQLKDLNPSEFFGLLSSDIHSANINAILLKISICIDDLNKLKKEILSTRTGYNLMLQQEKDCYNLSVTAYGLLREIGEIFAEYSASIQSYDIISRLDAETVQKENDMVRLCSKSVNSIRNELVRCTYAALSRYVPD